MCELEVSGQPSEHFEGFKNANFNGKLLLVDNDAEQSLIERGSSINNGAWKFDYQTKCEIRAQASKGQNSRMREAQGDSYL